MTAALARRPRTIAALTPPISASVTSSSSSIPVTPAGWRAFVRGAVIELQSAGYALTGAELTISGDLPARRGLSSSAALEVAVCLALLGIAGRAVTDRIALARICSGSRANGWGRRPGCSISSRRCCRRRATRCGSTSGRSSAGDVPLRLGGHRLVAVDSDEPRSLRDSGYNARREECREACRLLGVASLRDADLERAAQLPAPLDRRVRHVVTENGRVDQAIAAVTAGDMVGSVSCSTPHTQASATTTRSRPRRWRRRSRGCSPAGRSALGSSGAASAAACWRCWDPARRCPRGRWSLHRAPAPGCSEGPPPRAGHGPGPLRTSTRLVGQQARQRGGGVVRECGAVASCAIWASIRSFAHTYR